MTPQEAIRLVYCCMHVDDNEILTARDMAISALEKQIPKKPLKEYGGAYRCPNCQMKQFNPEWGGTKYCDCGQALDWGINV